MLVPGATPAGRTFTNRESGGGLAGARRTAERTLPKVGRNDPCPCGSGKKYKKCHGAGL